jgi:syntaxin 8
MSAALAQLTAQATQTLSLLLERERAQTLGGAAARAPHGAQIARNLGAIRTGVLALEARDGRSPASAILRAQHARMRGMLGPAGESIEPCVALRVLVCVH